MEVAIGRDENFSRHRVDTHTHTGISDELNTPFRVNAVVPLLQSDLPLFVPNYRRFPIKWRIAFSLAAGNFGIEERTTIVESTISKASSKRNFGKGVSKEGLEIWRKRRKKCRASTGTFFPLPFRGIALRESRHHGSRLTKQSSKFVQSCRVCITRGVPLLPLPSSSPLPPCVSRCAPVNFRIDCQV